jgi:hypothetical protein
MPLARVAPALVVGLLGAAALGPRLERDPDKPADLESLFESRDGCATVGSRAWSPLPGLAYTGVLGVNLPAGPGSLAIVIGDSIPLDLVAETRDGSAVLMRVERLQAGAGTQAPTAYWLEHGNPWAAPRAVVRATIDAFPREERAFTIRLGRRAPRVLARLFGTAADTRARVCAHPAGGAPAFADRGALSIPATAAEYFGTGWYGVQPVAGEMARWMGEHGAMLIPFERRGEVTVRVHTTGDGDPEIPVELTLMVNDTFHAQPVTLRRSATTYEWTIPQRAWVVGTNELLFSASRTTRLPQDSRDLGLALRSVQLELNDAVFAAASEPGAARRRPDRPPARY